MKVLVTEAGHRNALAIIRALGKEGVEVLGSGSHWYDSALFSKYCSKKLYYTPPQVNPSKFVEEMLGFVEEERPDIILPCGIATTVLLSKHKKEFEKYTRVPLVDYSKFLVAHDKSKAMKFAKKHGIAIPQTFFPKNLSELEDIAHELSYPAVIKIRKGAGAKGVRYANSATELIELYKTQYASSDNEIVNYEKPLIQEYIPGEHHDVAALTHKGNIRAILSQQRIKTHPPSGGGGIVNVTTHDPQLVKIGTKLLKELKWDGLALLDFKIDSRDDKPKLLEMNPKCWGTTALSVEAGINFPYLLCKMFLDGDVDPVLDYKVGLKYRWVYPYELYHFMHTPNKIANFSAFFRFWAPDTRYDFQFSDVLPNIVRLFEVAYRVVRKGEGIQT